MRGRVVRPEVDCEDVARSAQVGRHLQHRRDRARDPRALVDRRPLRRDRHLLLPREADRLAADRVVLAQRWPSQSSVHQDAPEVRVTLDADAHQVEGLALVPVGGRPDGTTLSTGSPSSSHTWTRTRAASGAEREQVVVHREALRLRRGLAREARPSRARSGRGRRPCRCSRRRAARPSRGSRSARRRRGSRKPCSSRRCVARLDEARRVDDERRLAVRVLRLDEAGNAFVAQRRRPRISYAGGTPASTFSCRRMIPSISASGRGGQPGTWMSTGTILSTPWRIV